MTALRRFEHFKRNVRHLFLFPFRYSTEGVKKRLINKILKIQNSVPLYLVVYPGDIAVQVGTPHFRTMKRFSNLAGSNGKVIIFEADPVNANNLVSNLSQLRHSNVTVINKGAWSEQNKLMLYKSEDFKGDHKIPVDGIVMDNDYRTTYTEKVEIEVDTLDNMLEDIGIESIDYLSITVNGAEFEVLKGAKNIISHSKGARIFSKGHARMNDGKSGKPINTLIDKYLSDLGCNVIITKGDKSISGIQEWKYREGDVFAMV